MPPTSTTIFEEGANVVSFKIVSEGVFDHTNLVKYMVDEPAQYPGSSGCRNIRDVESDLKAVCICTFGDGRLVRRTDVLDSKSRRTIKAYSSFKLVSPQSMHLRV